MLFRQHVRTPALRHGRAFNASIGILTDSPSTTPFGFALGPDLPPADVHGRGNLSLTVGGFLTRLLVTYAYICFSVRSTKPYSSTSPPTECSPTACLGTLCASVMTLMPVYYRRRQARPVSCYALFKGIAASKLTSWLSQPANFLCST